MKWRWNSGKKVYPDIPSPKGRFAGNVDLTDCDSNVDFTKIMKLPWTCPRCGNQMLCYREYCSRCASPFMRQFMRRGINKQVQRDNVILTPLGEWLLEQGRS